MPTISSVVRDINTGIAIQGATVRTYTQALVIDTQITSITGSFTTGILLPGFYSLVVSKDGYNQRSYQNTIVSSNITLSDIFLEPVAVNIFGQKSDGTWQTIRSNDKNSLVISEQPEMYSREGYYFGLTTGSQTVAANGFHVMQLTNPVASGKSLHLVRVVGGASTNTTIDLIKNATFTAAGTSLTPVNRNFNSSTSSIATAKWLSQATDPTTGGQLASSVIQTGGAIEVDYNGSWIMFSGNTLVIRLVNNANQNNILSIGISWWEETP